MRPAAAGPRRSIPATGRWPASAELARECEAAGLAFIGPPAEVLEAIGSRRAARALVSAAGLPVLPATAVPMHSLAERRVDVQVLADAHGNVVQLGERTCSIQHEHEPLIDESPAPGLDPALREAVLQSGVDAARALGYRSAGTVAGVIAGGEFHFVELHPLGQVAHSMSELVTGVDILREQLAVAAGLELSITQPDVWVRGHAIACRITAEDAAKGFMPAVGEITRYHEPGGHFVRVDSAVRNGPRLDDDPTIATLIVWDRDRDAATRRMLRALDDYEIEGPQTLLPFHRALLHTPEWASADDCHELIADGRWLTHMP